MRIPELSDNDHISSSTITKEAEFRCKLISGDGGIINNGPTTLENGGEHHQSTTDLAERITKTSSPNYASQSDSINLITSSDPRLMITPTSGVLQDDDYNLDEIKFYWMVFTIVVWAMIGFAGLLS
ncbi:hypothetical protein C1645_735501 [Glomus cerebriforme]|uniref:Uncharacterized protein n=1 Tax=Glomus cerebriforme TaxID=658196 RepID=A0A397TAP7_9GLOM|nr:hypothetical protein C1645_735501 [Glomus cerebriforme]